MNSMKTLCNIVILDKEYTVTEDGFGIKHINGQRIDLFLSTASPEVIEELAIKGAQLIMDKPFQAADIIQREELTLLEGLVNHDREVVG